MKVTVHASYAAIYDLDLDVSEGENIDVIHDVISAEIVDDELVIITHRSLERPDRPVYRIPRKYVDHYTTK